MADRLAVRVDNLQPLRRALAQVDKDALKEVQQVTKEAAEIVAAEARVLAPRRTGKLAASIKATTSGAKGVVRSRLPYAAVHEYGGTIAPRGRPIKIQGWRFIERARERKHDQVLDALARGFDDVLRRNGLS